MNGSFANNCQAAVRFLIERRIGAGGMGTVYRAFDRQRNQWVALKTLPRLDPEAIYLFKREFRTLADVVHPNLVCLHELIAEEGRWFFTMEFVEGVDFLEYVRRGVGHAASHLVPAGPPDAAFPATLSLAEWFASEGTSGATDGRENETTRQTPAEAPSTAVNTGGLRASQLLRLRAALEQLVQGVSALHEAGYIHRDIKPGNVRVTPQGRVVLLDFGLAASLGAADADGSPRIAGTAPYMSPEQAAGQWLGPASDWYSVGVVLYEALAGRRPFEGGSSQVLREKQHRDPTPLCELAPEAPKDLASLCMALLERDPARRPSGPEILRRLGSTGQETPWSDRLAVAPSPPAPLFVGRQALLRQLDEALHDLGRGRPVAVLIEGRSGVGKTALVQQFLSQLGARRGAVVLTGRCYERESVPYKAVDNAIDALSRYLATLSAEEVNALLPRDAASLVRVFPVLEWVNALAVAPRRAPDIRDPQELRQRAFTSLREVLARLGDRKTLVVAIDDLQWGDLDSVALLHDLLRPPDPPVFLLIVCYRSEDVASSPALRAMLDPTCLAARAIEPRKLVVEPLGREEACELALVLLGRRDEQAQRLSRTIAEESQGNPYLVDALVRHTRAARDPAAAAPRFGASLDEVLWARVGRLPEPARRLLEVIAVAAHPLRQSDALRAAEFDEGSLDAVRALQIAHLVRTTGCRPDDWIETYHDRIRETVVAHLTAEIRVQRHLALAQTLETTSQADPAQLAAHFAGAGRNDRASDYYAAAADQAAAALAFDRAARLYRLALELSPRAGEAERPRRRKLADALANAGYGKEAAEAYLLCAAGAPHDEAFELRRRAAAQYLISGHIDEGLAVLEQVLQARGMRLPRTPRAAMGSLLFRRVLLWSRGFGCHVRDVGAIPPRDLDRIDLCWSAATGLALVDPIRAAALHAQGLMRALRCGEPLRAARFLAMEGILAAIPGEPARRRVQKMLMRAEGIGRGLQEPYTTGLLAAAQGVTACLQGRWKRSVEQCDRAERLFREHCTGVIWELDTVQGFAPSALSWAGEVGELSRRLPGLYRDAERRGSLFALARICTLALPALAADEPDQAERRIAECMRRWSRESFHVQHYNALYAQIQIDLYRGKGPNAWQRIEQEWCALERSLLLRSQLARVFIHFARARSALAAAAEGYQAAPLLRAAARDARRIDREQAAWAVPLARLILAGLAVLRRDSKAAREALEASIAGFDAADMPLYAAAARRALGRLVGGDEGRALLAQGDQWMSSQGIRNPDRMTALFVPWVA
ncbi:MAG: protein kinase [Thermoguttaceae bacterium]|jgi:serine/threonine protein kinase|nr:protein kinase [Thermoguttaceae bacterium]